jgi:LCP family protein required for cell wall assembly
LPRAYFIPGQAQTPNKAEIVVGDLRSSAKHRHRAASTKTRRRRWVHATGAVVAVATLLATGSGYWMAHGMLSGITVSQALGSQDPKSSGGGMNILLIGLDSRKDQNGDDLPWSLLKHLHAGDSDDGGYNTNTLILAHVGEDDRVSAFSIPRDDWVSFNGVPGYNHIKIKEAYGLTKQYVEQKMIDKGASNQKELETKGREAARAATLKAVRKLTGVPIDYFAEVNLAGFYELAHQFGGIEACLKSWNNGQNLHDTNSGFDAPHAGYLHLDAAQSLAFVRERDNLPNGDLDRTHRQQAVIDYVIWKLKNEGILSSIGQLTSLINVAKKFVITDQGWQLFSFASDIKSLTGKNLTFKTAPVITTDGHMAGQTVNLIDPAQVKQFVQATFYPPTATAQPAPTESSLAPGATTVDVLNGGAASGLAGQMSQALAAAGYKPGQVGNTAAHSATQVVYGTGGRASAQKIADAFQGVTASASSAVPAGHVQLILGPDAISVPAGLGTAASTPTASPTPSGTSSTSNGGAGGTVSVKANAPYGIPCVY